MNCYLYCREKVMSGWMYDLNLMRDQAACCNPGVFLAFLYKTEQYTVLAYQFVEAPQGSYGHGTYELYLGLMWYCMVKFTNVSKKVFWTCPRFAANWVYLLINAPHTFFLGNYVTFVVNCIFLYWRNSGEPKFSRLTSICTLNPIVITCL